MPKNRIKVVCTVTAVMAVTLVLAVHAGSPKASSGAPGASGAAQGKVRIELTGRVLGPRGNRGRFILSGALTDRGRFVDAPGLNIPRTRASQASWRITKGTKAYAGLHGRGTERGLYDNTIHITMTGRVWR
jgi:hypothetical protein